MDNTNNTGLYCHPNKMMNNMKRDDKAKKYIGKNYINLTQKARKSNNIIKVNHINTILKRREDAKNSGELIPQFLELIYLIRCHCIVMAYFPRANEYHKLFENYQNHLGWKDNMSRHERNILFSFKRALDAIKKNPYNTYLFNEADYNFGIYRHARWFKKDSLCKKNSYN